MSIPRKLTDVHRRRLQKAFEDAMLRPPRLDLREEMEHDGDDPDATREAFDAIIAAAQRQAARKSAVAALRYFLRRAIERATASASALQSTWSTGGKPLAAPMLILAAILFAINRASSPFAEQPPSATTASTRAGRGPVSPEVRTAIQTINPANIHNLTLLGSYALQGRPAGPPVVVDGRMYIPTDQAVIALALHDGGQPIWSYHFDDDEQSLRYGSERRIAYGDGKLFVALRGGTRLLALDSTSGAKVWSAGDAENPGLWGRPGDAPVVMKDKVVLRICALSGSECEVTAYRLQHGTVAWRVHDNGHEAPERRSQTPPAGGSTSGGVSRGSQGIAQLAMGDLRARYAFDPIENTFYYGANSATPFEAADDGSNLRVWARNSDTGALKWIAKLPAVQDAPGSGVSDLIFGLVKDGTKLVTVFDANGNAYSITALGGTIVQVAAAEPAHNVSYSGSCGSSSVYNARSGLIYTASNIRCGGRALPDVKSAESLPSPWKIGPDKVYRKTASLNKGEPGVTYDAADGSAATSSIVARSGSLRFAWARSLGSLIVSGLAVTEGEVLFFGTNKGELAAMDSKTGGALWSFPAQASSSAVVTYVHEGREYIAVVGAMERAGGQFTRIPATGGIAEWFAVAGKREQ